MKIIKTFEIDSSLDSLLILVPQLLLNCNFKECTKIDNNTLSFHRGKKTAVLTSMSIKKLKTVLIVSFIQIKQNKFCVKCDYDIYTPWFIFITPHDLNDIETEMKEIYSNILINLGNEFKA